jgi:hypothetical protein
VVARRYQALAIAEGKRFVREMPKRPSAPSVRRFRAAARQRHEPCHLSIGILSTADWPRCPLAIIIAHRDAPFHRGVTRLPADDAGVNDF